MQLRRIRGHLSKSGMWSPLTEPIRPYPRYCHG